MIRILFTKRYNFNPLSWLIMKMESVGYSHVAIMVYTDIGPMVFQSSVHGVEAISYKQFIKINEVVDSIDLRVTDAQRKAIFFQCLELMGISFSVLGLIGAGVARIFKSGKNIFSDGNKTEFCSEFVYDVLQEALNLSGYNPEIDGPKKLMEILRNEKQSRKSNEGIQIW